MKRELFLIVAVIAGAVSAGEFGVAIKGTSGFEAKFKSPSASGVYLNNPGVDPNTGTALIPTDHAYDNGFVNGVGLSGGGNGSSNWQIDDPANQVAGNVVTFQSTKIMGGGVNTTEDNGGLEPGFELFYRDQLWRGDHSLLGWVVGMTYQRVEVNARGTEMWATETTTDTYRYDVAFPPAGAVPSVNTGDLTQWLDPQGRIVTAGTLAYQYNREINADLFGIKAGPVWELYLMDKLSLVTGAGVSMQWIRSEFSYTDGATSGATTDDGILFGAYAQSDLEYAVSDRWRLFAGVEWGTQQSFSQSVDGYESELQGTSLISGRLGVAVSF